MNDDDKIILKHTAEIVIACVQCRPVDNITALIDEVRAALTKPVPTATA